MSWVIVDSNAEMERHQGDPDMGKLRRFLADGGPVELVATGYAVWAVVSPAETVPNPVAGTMAVLLDAAWQPFTGPVAFVGRIGPHRDQAFGPLDADTLNAVQLMHAQVSTVLDIPIGSTGPVPEYVPVSEIRRAGEYMLTAGLSWT